jgi:adenylosuccinate lyase
VQRNAMKVWEEIQKGKTPVNEKGESLFLQYLLADEDLRKYLSEDEIKSLFDYNYYTRNVDKIFKRVFGE